MTVNMKSYFQQKGRATDLLPAEGWQKVAGGRSAVETSGSVVIGSAILEGWQSSATPAGSMGGLGQSGGIASAFAPLRRVAQPPATVWQASGLLAEPWAKGLEVIRWPTPLIGHPKRMESQATIAEVRVNKLAANVVATLLTGVFCVVGVMLARALPHHIKFAYWHLKALLVASILLVPVHEALHAVGWRVFARVEWRHIRFGVMWWALMPFCHCAAQVPIGAYRRMALFPLWITGSVSIAALFVFPADCMGVFAGVAVAACVGDVWIVSKLRRFADMLLVRDSPSAIGCDVLSAQAEIGSSGAAPNDNLSGPGDNSGTAVGPASKK
jgi:Putative zincin peptidase